MLNVDHLSLYSQVKINQGCNVKASLSWSRGVTQPEGVGGFESMWQRAELIQSLSGYTGRLYITLSCRKGTGQDTQSVSCKSLCPGQQLAPLCFPRRKRVDRCERGKMWLQLCCCAGVTTHCPLLTASSKAIIKFLVEKEKEEKAIMSWGQVSQSKSNRDQTSLRLLEESGFEIQGWGSPLTQNFHSYKV